MRIASVTLRNYRVHRELKVDFDPSRTLIGGPNETGKSTLIEALHRALFLKAKGNTEHHRAMISQVHPGHPEVELRFETRGNSYLLKKRFGTSGTTTLAPSNGVPLAGDAAESELARLLSVETGIAGKALKIQWSHLWVWQGQAGDDPTALATAQQHGLLQRLQHMGGAAAVQSELDARVAQHFALARDQIYTQAGKAKAGTELERAEHASLLAQEELALARDRVRKLDTAAADLEAASRTLLATSATLAELDRQQQEVEAKTRRLAELRSLAAERAHVVAAAVARLSAAEAAHQQILKARVEIADLESNLKPQDEAIARLAAASDAAKARASAAEAAHRTVAEAVRAARLRHDLACAQTLRFEKAELHRKLSDKAQTVAQRRRDQAGLEERLAKLPKVDKAGLRKLQRLDADCSNALTALRAMATGLAVVAANVPVTAGGQSIEVGQQQILTEDTEVQIGAAIRLRVQPGGGNSLANARQAEAEARKELRSVLDSWGLQSVQEAAEVQAGREELGSRIKAAQAELAGLGAEHLAEELQGAQNELTAASTNVERLMALTPDWTAPNDKAAARILAQEWADKLTAAERHETEARTARDGVAQAQAAAETAVLNQRTESERQRLELHGLKSRLDLLLTTHGDDVPRRQALLECQSALALAQDLLKETADAAVALQPELLAGDRARITRALKESTSEQSESRTRIAVAKAALNSDGSEDPSAGFATAEAKARAASAHRDSVSRQAGAIALLDQLFREEQRQLAAQFTQPLADKISGYLQCIFGAGTRAQVELENHEFTGLRLLRPGWGAAPFAFGDLSGGAREQAAAAVRLAMAEVLAADFDGCLPVVFDDAFAYSDPERVNRLQRMLDLAATRGLQVIVLTCNPVDYVALGAKTVTLRAEPTAPA